MYGNKIGHNVIVVENILLEHLSLKVCFFSKKIKCILLYITLHYYKCIPIAIIAVPIVCVYNCFKSSPNLINCAFNNAERMIHLNL